MIYLSLYQALIDAQPSKKKSRPISFVNCFTRHLDILWYWEYFVFAAANSRNSSFTLSYFSGLVLVAVRAETGTGSVGLTGADGFNSVVAFDYLTSDTTRNKCSFSLSPRSEGTNPAFDTSLSRSSLILVYVCFSPSCAILVRVG